MASAAPAAAQEPGQSACVAPQIVAFLPPDPVARSGRYERLQVETDGGATSVTVDWPDGTSATAPSQQGRALFRTTFATTGRKRIVATALAECGAASRAAFTLDVLAPCARAFDRSLDLPDCDLARGGLRLAQGGRSVPGAWLNAPCRDVAFPPRRERPEPVARAADCVLARTRFPIAGRLPARRGGVLRIVLGAPARGVRVALADANRRLTRWVRASRRSGGGRMWAIRLGNRSRSDRLLVDVARAAGPDRWAVGLRGR